MFNIYTYAFFFLGILLGYFFHPETMIIFFITIMTTIFFILKKYIDDVDSINDEYLPYNILFLIVLGALIDKLH